MTAIRPAILCAALSTQLHAGDPKLDLAALPSSKEAKDSVILPHPPSAVPRWSIGAGIVFRKLGEISFDTGISPNMIPNLFDVNSFTEPPGIGPLDAAGDRIYDDGFVNIGAATPGTGLTTYWGYNDASQIQDGSLLYSRTGGERRDVTMSSTADPTGWSNDSEWNAGPFLELTYSVPLRSNLTAGVAINFSSVNIDGSQSGLGTISQFQQLDVYDVTAVDTHSLNGIVPPIAPYRGSFAGPGPLIGNVPDSRAFPESLASTETAFFADQIRDELQLDLHTIGVGGTLNWSPHPRVLVAGQAGVALNLADWRAERSEVIGQSNNGGPSATFSRQSVHTDELDFLAGVYLQGNAAWALNERWALQAFVRYDWNQDLDGRAGTSTFDVDLSGWSIGAGARLSF